MDTVWRVRQAYEKARQIKEAQDDYCAAAVHGQWDLISDRAFPEELQWESMVAILRGQVKVQTHCYEATDITNFVRISNEFRFPVAAFHHAHEAYLVPEVLRSAYGGTPAIAQFAAFSRYKREAYRHSQYAPRILAEEGIPVVMKSDHPAISRTLLHEAQQAHYHGLPWHIALTSVTTTPAKATGLDWRLGAIKPGLDADVVLWDSHPLALGATPSQVFIDGIPQLKGLKVEKPKSLQEVPKTPNFDKEANLTLKVESLVKTRNVNLYSASMTGYHLLDL
jgi:imidazolonepropionase-like amidohydrolase